MQQLQSWWEWWRSEVLHEIWIFDWMYEAEAYKLCKKLCGLCEQCYFKSSVHEISEDQEN